MADDATAAFLAEVPAGARARFADLGAVRDVLGVHDAASRAAHPSIDRNAIDEQRFAAELGRRLGEGATPEALAAVHAADVYLAIACCDGDPAAVAILERDFLREVDFAARKVRAAPDQADEVRGHLRRVLFVAEPGRRAGLSDFAGRGDLRGYIRVIATR